jgi:hypothetical protein
MEVEVPIEKFEYCPKDILERLFQETQLQQPLTMEDFLKLPTIDNYVKTEVKEATPKEDVEKPIDNITIETKDDKHQ